MNPLHVSNQTTPMSLPVKTRPPPGVPGGGLVGCDQFLAYAFFALRRRTSSPRPRSAIAAVPGSRTGRNQKLLLRCRVWNYASCEMRGRCRIECGAAGDRLPHAARRDGSPHRKRNGPAGTPAGPWLVVVGSRAYAFLALRRRTSRPRPSRPRRAVLGSGTAAQPCAAEEALLAGPAPVQVKVSVGTAT